MSINVYQLLAPFSLCTRLCRAGIADNRARQIARVPFAPDLISVARIGRRDNERLKLREEKKNCCSLPAPNIDSTLAYDRLTTSFSWFE